MIPENAPLKRYLNEISECPLSNNMTRHQFCDDCLEEFGKPGERNLCPLCRRLFEMSSDGLGGVPKKQLIGKLNELHALELSSYGHGGRTFGIPLRVKFELRLREPGYTNVTWFENKIYVVAQGFMKILAFSDMAPFEELPEDAIDFPHRLIFNCVTVASASSRSIFVSQYDSRPSWKIQMPEKVITEWKIDGYSKDISVSASDALVVVVERDNNDIRTDEDNERDAAAGYVRKSRIYLDVYRASDVCLLRKVIIPKKVNTAYHALLTPDDTFIICYSIRDLNGYALLVSELSSDGQKFLRTFDIRSFVPIEERSWYLRSISATGDGRYFVVDPAGHRVLLLNAHLTDYQLLEVNGQSEIEADELLYLNDKKQLLAIVQRYSNANVCFLNLSICEEKRTNLAMLTKKCLSFGRKPGVQVKPSAGFQCAIL